MPLNTSEGKPTSAPQPPPPTAQATAAGVQFGVRDRRFLLTVSIATLVLGSAWIAMIRGAIADALFSYAILIPCISTWLVWQRRFVSPRLGETHVVGGVSCLALAAAVGLGGVYAWRSEWITDETSWLTTQMAAWVLAVWGAATFHFGTRWIRENAFAVAFLVFTIPLPEPAVRAIEFGLQSASAEASDWLFHLSGATYMRDGMAFWLPNIHIEVAPECSGIRSTLVLFITGILGAHLLLRNFVHQTCVALVIIPLGIFRNAIRILTLTLLSVHVNPEIMNSALHKRGGPLFFAVSLIPLFALFWWFSRRERQAKAPR